MERRGFGFFTKRSQHYDNLQQADSQANQQKTPLKDSTNTAGSPKQQKLNNNNNEEERQEAESTQEEAQTQQQSRSLQCLETLAQKAGIHDITPDDCKYDIANTLLNLDRGHEFIKQSVDSTMADIKQQQQQIAEASAQQQQQIQQVAMQQQQQQQQQQQEQQTLVPAQSPQHLQQVPQQPQQQQHTVSMHQQVAQQGQVIQTQGGQVLTTAQSGSTTITTMSPLQQTQGHQQQVDWSHGRAVQVIQQPIQNPTYLQQLYNPQGQLLMPLHPTINPQQIQVITKPFQSNQLTPHMLATAQNKQVIQGSQAATFPGYTTIPTIPTTQNQQTLVFSQLGVISSQPNILPNHSAQDNNQVGQQKPQEMHKVMAGQKVMQKVASSTSGQAQQPGQCVQVSQAMIGTQPTAQIISPIQSAGPSMQFAPWQFTTGGIPQVWTTNGLQSQTLLAAPNQIFIRGTQPDGTPGMFIQQSPQTIQTQQNQALAPQGAVQQIAKPRPANENIQPKQQAARPLNILPSNAVNIRPASSVSTQTIGAQTPTYYLQASMGKPGTKIRTKAPQIRTPPAPKADAANQTQIKPYTGNIQQRHIVSNKMLVVNNATGMATMAPGSPMTAEKAQQLANQQQKAVQQGQAQQQAVQQQVLMQQQLQQQQAIQQYQLQQGQPTHIQPKPMMMQTIQGIPPQQLQMAGDRPIMPVVSMSAQANNQALQQGQLSALQQGLPLQSNLAVTQQQMQLGMQQLHSVNNLQMAPPGTIIGQIQAQPQALTQVTAANQLQQLHPGTTQTITLQAAPITAPQQVQLSASVPQIKDEQQVDSSATLVGAPVVVPPAELPKENGLDSTVQNDVKQEEIKPMVNGLESNILQPAPIPGTVPSLPSTNQSAENGHPVAAATAEEVKERCPPKAMIKPQVLTHVIEDFVIQESSEPFPVTRSMLLGDLKPTTTSDKDLEEPPRKKRASSPPLKPDMAKCENCGRIDLKSKFRKNKRFCSVVCSKGGKFKDDKKVKWDKDGMEVEVDSIASGAESSLSPNELLEEDNTPKVDPLKWSVQEVSEFIKNLPGCSDYSEDFLIQEIDGQALMLLKEDHLMSAMSMKLGPALKIVAKIDEMRIDKEPPKQAS